MARRTPSLFAERMGRLDSDSDMRLGERDGPLILGSYGTPGQPARSVHRWPFQAGISGAEIAEDLAPLAHDVDLRRRFLAGSSRAS